MNISQPRERQRHQPNQSSADGRQTLGLRINGVSTGTGAPEDNTINRAQRFEEEKHRIIASCFAKRDETGSLMESYITHIQVTEDATYPSSPPPPDSALENKKPRVIIVAVRKSGRVRMHKARENANGSFSIGKSWVLDDLSSIESFSAPHPSTPEEEESRRWAGNVGFLVTISKPYFWQADTLREKEFFIASLVKIYRKYTGGKVPSLIGFDPRETQQLLGTPNHQSGTASLQPRASEEPVSPLTANDLESAGQQTPPQLGHQPQNSVQTPPSLLPAHLSQSVTMQSRDGSITSLEAGNINASTNGSMTDKTSSQTSLPLRSGTGSVNDSQVMDDGRGRARPEASNWAPKRIGGSPGRQHQSSPQRPPFNSRLSNEGQFGTNLGRASPTGRGVSSSRTTPTASQMDVRSNTSSREHMNSQSATSSARPSLEDRQPSSSRERIFRDEHKASLDSVRSRDSPRPERFAMPGGWTATPELSDKTSFISDRSEMGKSPPPPPLPPPSTFPAPTAPMASNPPEPTASPSTEMNNEEESHRPGLGPMIKKKTAREVATTFRKAATAYNSFKPRVGGAGDRLREKEAEKRSSAGGEPDGIHGVVPAPSSLIRSHDKEMTPDDQSRPSISSSTHSAPEDQQRGQITEDTKPNQEEVPNQPSSPASAFPSKVSPTEEAEQPETQATHTQTEFELIRLAKAIDLPPSIFLSDSRASEIYETYTNTLRSFNFDPTEPSAFDSANIDRLQAEIKKEIDQVEAGTWLLNIDEHDARVEEVDNLLTKAIAECDIMDGLLSLYSAEMNTIAEDVRYIESQAGGLATEMANMQALKREVERVLVEDHGVSLDALNARTPGSDMTGMGLSSVRETTTDSMPAPLVSAGSQASGFNHSNVGSSSSSSGMGMGMGPGMADRYGQQRNEGYPATHHQTSASMQANPPNPTTIRQSPFPSTSSSNPSNYRSVSSTSNPFTSRSVSSSTRGDTTTTNHHPSASMQQANPPPNTTTRPSPFSSTPSSTNQFTSRSGSASTRDATRRLMERRERWESRSGE
ncbi:MAG: hypothetical protein M1816_006261 [Peltula sp. TS41687]|nr:MAG: hypothetical protein M1816_006261 [Peltula sp. TS41687]